jgi:predicted tellurium resistance membrane protein TerC
LVFIGLKMLVADFYNIPIALYLGVVAVILGASVLPSVLLPAPKRRVTGG